MDDIETFLASLTPSQRAKLESATLDIANITSETIRPPVVEILPQRNVCLENATEDINDQDFTDHDDRLICGMWRSDDLSSEVPHGGLPIDALAAFIRGSCPLEDEYSSDFDDTKEWLTQRRQQIPVGPKYQCPGMTDNAENPQ